MQRGVKREAPLVLWKHHFIQFHCSFVSKKSHFVSHCGTADGSTSEPRALFLWEKPVSGVNQNTAVSAAKKRRTILCRIHPENKEEANMPFKYANLYLWLCFFSVVWNMSLNMTLLCVLSSESLRFGKCHLWGVSLMRVFLFLFKWKKGILKLPQLTQGRGVT